MHLIIGLGNPGQEYENTRHNAGANIIIQFAKKSRLPWKKHKAGALIAIGAGTDEKLIIARPLSYMNESGAAVAALAHFFKIPTQNIIVVYDDLDLPFGGLRISSNKTSGGHNGVQSIIEHLGSSEFVRVRFGIGPKVNDAAEFVLQPWSKIETKKLSAHFKRANDALEELLISGLERAATLYNTKNPA